MAHMTLPAAHSQADARLAERIGRTLGVDEIHVFWTHPDARRDRAYAGVIGALAALGDRLVRLAQRR